LTYADTAGSDDEHADEWDEVSKGRRRERARSVTSMPGSLDDIHFAIDSGDESGYSDHAFDGAGEDEYEGEMEEAEEANEEALDEDFLATTQMKNVPFL
jgi:phosphatidate phosphatase LPIN